MDQLEFIKAEIPPQPKPLHAVEYKVIALRDCPSPAELLQCDTPHCAAEYWKTHIATSPQFNPDCECLAVILLNTRFRVKGHQIVTIGLLDQVLAHSREVFRTAIVAAAHSVVVMHNHPSGDPTPSASDILVTKNLAEAGRILKMGVIDHIIITGDRHISLRELGYLQ